MPAFAIYRLPYKDKCHVMMQKEGEPDELPSVDSLSGKSGFAVAPFAADKKHPVLLIHPDKCVDMMPEELTASDGAAAEVVREMQSIIDAPKQVEKIRRATRTHYAIDFANFHAHIQEGDFSKIVLARCRRDKNEKGMTPLEMFATACRLYPRLFVTLVSAYKSGTWLMATPEVLIEGDGQKWTSMSLAGTMHLTEDMLDFDNPPSPDPKVADNILWSIKNIQEQRYVSTYITESLEQVAADIEEKGPYTMRAGNLVHLRSDFHFTMPQKDSLGRLLAILYPTPAVCGLPKEAARDFIINNEYTPRLYYSGFVGPLEPNGETHLYVSLRCMRIEHDECCLYAGGGLLADSNQEAEWKETEDKMETMGVLLHPNGK